MYARLLQARWRVVLPVAIAVYMLVAALFALVYMTEHGAIDGARPGHFGDAFFFSVQTLSTIGYGVMSPRGSFANAVVSAEAFVGMLITAMATGIVFAKFSRPTSRVLFSDKLCVYTRDGQDILALRVANARGNDVTEASVRIAVLFDEISVEGERLRRVLDLDLVRQTTPIFVMSWMIMHPITPDSPLYGLTRADLVAKNAAFVVTLTGFDGTFSQTVHAHALYNMDDVHVGVRFVDMLSPRGDGRMTVDYRMLHEVEPAAGCPAGSWALGTRAEP